MTDSEQTHNEKEHRLNRKRFIVEILTLFAVIFYGWVAFRQWREMESSVKEAKRAADAAARAADIADATQKSIDKSSQEDRRAWVGPISGSISPPIAGHSKTIFSVAFNNTGKTPAVKFTGLIFRQGLPKGERPKIGIPGKSPPATQPGILVIQPQALISLQSETLDVDDGVIDFIKNESIILCVHGFFSYEDIFKHPWGGTFCMYISPDLKQMRFCGFGNSTR